MISNDELVLRIPLDMVTGKPKTERLREILRQLRQFKLSEAELTMLETEITEIRRQLYEKKKKVSVFPPADLFHHVYIP